ncbi:MAG: sulfite exporter TauE/SafE family protein [Peptostreptococcaceae bacterium]|nr:sulfite exporter TauE/SafE family protein [Peptostreptococcaceae bacterium]
MNFLHITIILLAGTCAGFLNTLAGGGSLITMPILIFMGLPSAVANGTNRIALLFQNTTATYNFKRKGYFDWRLVLMLSAPAILGAALGSSIAVDIPDHIFNRLLAGVMIMVLMLILFKPKTKQKEIVGPMTFKRKMVAIVIFFFVGLYGGIVQAGVGFIIIASLTWITGSDLVRINSIKVFIVAIYTFFALVVFATNGKVDLILGLTLAVGNSLGAWIGSNFAVKKGDRWIRMILAFAVVGMAIKLVFTS